MKRTLSVLLALTLLASTLAGCSSTQTGSDNTTATASASTSVPTEASTPAETSASTEASASGDTQVITDMAGREVTVPTEINSVYCAVPTGEAMVATLFQEKLVGWVNTPSENALKYLSPAMASLPVVGGWMGSKVTANMEDIIKLAPDVIIYMGTDITTDLSDTPDEIQAQTSIPVIVVPSEFEHTAETYRFLGKALGVPERGEQLAEYTEQKIAAVQEAVAKVPDDERVSVYYAEGDGGLTTDVTGSDHTEVLAYANVINVADKDISPDSYAATGMGMAETSLEQVIGWNPDVILVSSTTSSNFDEIKNNSAWADIQAVKDGKIYMTPSYPFNWFDRPPNIMRVLGLEWFAEQMYPTYVNIDINSEIKNFFSLFYDVDLTDDEVTSLLDPNPTGVQ